LSPWSHSTFAARTPPGSHSAGPGQCQLEHTQDRPVWSVDPFVRSRRSTAGIPASYLIGDSCSSPMSRDAPNADTVRTIRTKGGRWYACTPRGPPTGVVWCSDATATHGSGEVVFSRVYVPLDRRVPPPPAASTSLPRRSARPPALGSTPSAVQSAPRVGAVARSWSTARGTGAAQTAWSEAASPSQRTTTRPVPRANAQRRPS
jgi:hypothetical protein